MVRAIPPLSALLAFEAVARRLSFTQAAQELHVTPGAVSQQVKALEERVGKLLFDRTRRSVSLTGTARAMLPDVQAGLQLLVRAVEERAVSPLPGSLTISVAPSFASKWLMPRLPQFTAAHPEIDLQISATVSLAEFGRNGPDLAIRFGHGDYGGDLHSEKLLSEWLTPMCSPKLRGLRSLKAPADLLRARLLHDSSIPGVGASSAWNKWFALAEVEESHIDCGMRFTLAEHALQAAVDGAGVVLGRLCLAERDLKAGRLVRLMDMALPLDVGYYLVMPKVRRERAEIQSFREWLLGAARKSATAKERRVGRRKLK